MSCGSNSHTERQCAPQIIIPGVAGNYMFVNALTTQGEIVRITFHVK